MTSPRSGRSASARAAAPSRWRRCGLAVARLKGGASRFARARRTVIKTTGDRVQDRPLAEIGGKGLFAKEIEQALLDGAIDCAVHSLKDLETRLPAGLVIGAVLARADPRDALIAPAARSLAELPPGATFATGSIRREAQLRALRPDFVFAPMRGNVDTRLAKIRAGAAAATLLAVAGLARLGLAVPEACRSIPMCCCRRPARASIALQCRERDARVRDCSPPPAIPPPPPR